MGLIYTVAFENGTITNAGGDFDVFYLQPADDKPIRVLRVELDVTSEVGDTQEEHLRLAWIRGHTSAGSGGTSATPLPKGLNGGTVAGFTARYLDGTIASGGTTKTWGATGMNERAGYACDYDEKTAPECSQADTSLVLRSMGTVADDISINGTIWVEELGT
jgi:hypothetical protein